MNDEDIATLLREAAGTVEAPDFVGAVQTRVARARRRRAQLAATLSVSVVALVVFVAGQWISTTDRSGPPLGTQTRLTEPTAPPTSSADPTQVAGPLKPHIAQQPWTSERIDALPRIDIGLPRVVPSSPDGLPALSDEPIDRALMAVAAEGDGTGILVLGDDGGWRFIDQPLSRRTDVNGYSSDALWNTSLSADGRFLAVPQPDEAVVIDVTSGDARTYDVPGYNHTAIWSSDDRWLLLNTEEQPGGSLLRLSDARVTHVPYGWFSAFAGSREVVEVADTAPLASELRTYQLGNEQPSAIAKVANLSGSPEGAGPVLFGGVLAGVTEPDAYSIPRGREEWGGILVMERATGNPLALLPMHDYADLYSSVPLGWLDEETVLVYTPGSPSTSSGHIVAWNYETGDISLVSDVPQDLAVSVAADQLG